MQTTSLDSHSTRDHRVPAGADRLPAPLAALLAAAIILGSCGGSPRPTLIAAGGGIFRHGGVNEDERPVHTDTLSPFSIGRTEVTVAQFRAFALETGYLTLAERLGSARGVKDGVDALYPGLSWKSPGFAQGDEEPVTCLSWYDACAYCNWLSGKEGLSVAYTARGEGDFVKWRLAADDETKDSFAIDPASKGYRLPTEAEWEFCARGGRASGLFAYAGGDVLDAVAWTPDNSGGKTHPVAAKQPNELGLYDMGGNVWEWCWDWWGYYSEEGGRDPLGAEGGRFRVMRGGGWFGVGNYCYSPFYRGSSDPAERSSAVGFRVARSD